MQFYRYEAREYAVIDQWGDAVRSKFPDPKVELTTYELIKETPKGYWIGFGEFGFSSYNWKKWVSKSSLKRYAYPTKEEAMTNFIKRTEKRIKILSCQKLACEMAIMNAKNIKL